MADAPLLELADCTVRFGGLTAVSSFSLTLNERDLISLIGPNGAGKTTVFNAITGVYPLASGAIHFRGRSISRMPPYRVARLGVARTFQNVRLFRGLTVLDNLRAALHAQCDYGFLRAAVHSLRWRRTEQRIEDNAMELLDSFGLLTRAHELAGGLPYGVQRRLEIVRALALRPRLLLLDEPAAGMNPSETAHLMELIHALPGQHDLAVLLIEHDMRVVMGLSQRVVVLNYGQQIAAGTPQEIAHHPAVIEAYLGEAVD